jgi:hypothetical protein
VTTPELGLAEISDGVDAKGTDASPRQTVGAVILALSDVMTDTIGRFEQIAARITQIVLTKGSNSQQELIVELQSFDRLQQEFTAFTNALARCAAVGDELHLTDDQDSRLRSEVIAAITVSELRGRLLRRLESNLTNVMSSLEDEAIF